MDIKRIVVKAAAATLAAGALAAAAVSAPQGVVHDMVNGKGASVQSMSTSTVSNHVVHDM